MAYSEFHTISRNFSYFSHFWANFNMLGIKMHVLELRNSMVILSRTPSRNFMQFSCNFSYFSHFWAIFNMFGNKMLVLELRNSVVILSTNFTQFSQDFTQFWLFQPFFVNSNILGIEKHVLQLRNSLVLLAEAISLKMGPQAPKRNTKASRRGQGPPLEPSARARLFGKMRQNILVT